MVVNGCQCGRLSGDAGSHKPSTQGPDRHLGGLWPMKYSKGCLANRMTRKSSPPKSMASKRPRGLWKSQRTNGKVTEAIVTDIHIEHIPEPQDISPVTKKRRLSYTEKSPVIQRSKADVEDWEDVKELFAHAVDKYEADSPGEAVELFRQVIHESDRLLRLYPDPFLLLSTGQESGFGGSSLRIRSITPSIRDPIRATDPLTTFHYVYGTSMLLLGKILEEYPTLAKEIEPVGTPAFYLAALDVLEDGQNAPHSVSSHKFTKEDWRLALSIGRTLVCLADEKLRRLSPDISLRPSSMPTINFQDDLWPKDSAFGPSFTRRPPLTRRITLPPMTPHEIIMQATDHFSRAMLHMPHPRHYHNHQKSDVDRDVSGAPGLSEDVDAPPTMPGLFTSSRKLLCYLRPRILFTLSSEVLSIADRMLSPFEKEIWAKWADDVFMQMETDEPGEENWSHPIAVGRGRCWFIIGETRFEAIESRLERGELILASEEVEDAKAALIRAVEYLERARETRPSSSVELQDPFATDVSPMLGEAFVTLAALTPDGPRKEEFFARASAEGINVDEEEDQVMDED